MPLEIIAELAALDGLKDHAKSTEALDQVRGVLLATRSIAGSKNVHIYDHWKSHAMVRGGT